MSTPYTITSWAWGDGVTVNGQGLRHVSAALLNKLGTTDVLASRGGVLDTAANALEVTPNTGMSLYVTRGQVVVPSSTALTGIYVGYIPSTAGITLTAADASYPRYDRIVVKVTDIGTSGSTMQVIPVDGTPASSPVIPAEPADSITIAVVYVGAGVTTISAGNITDYRKYTTGAGGILPVSSSTDFPSTGSQYGYFHDMSLSNLWHKIGSTNYPVRGTHRCTSSTRPTNKLEGTLIYETDTETILCWDGAAWVVVQDVSLKSYTPAWTSSGTAPAVGNGTIVGAYSRSGKMIDVMIKMILGSTSTAGTGTYYWSLPFAPASTAYSENMGSFTLNDSGAGTRVGTLAYSTSTKVYALYPYNISGTEITMNAIVAGTPLVWNTGDYITMRLRYEMA